MNFFDTKNNRVVFLYDYFPCGEDSLEVGGSYTKKQIQYYIDSISLLGFEEVSVDGIVDDSVADGITFTLNFSLFECTRRQVEKCKFINGIGGRRSTLLLPKSIQEQALTIFKENEEVTPWLLHGRIIKDVVLRWYEEQGYIMAIIVNFDDFQKKDDPETILVIAEGVIEKVDLVFIEADHADHKNEKMKDIQMNAHRKILKKMESAFRKILSDHKVVPGQIYHVNNARSARSHILSSPDILLSSISEEVAYNSTLNSLYDPRKLVIKYELKMRSTNPPWAKLR